jgi:hypothetical protein
MGSWYAPRDRWATASPEVPVRFLRPLLAIFTVGALAVGFTACGGDDGGSPLSATDDTTAGDGATDDTVDEPTDDTTDDSGDSTDDSGDGEIDEFCLSEEFMAAAESAGMSSDSEDPEEIARFFEEMADEAPSEISDDFATFAEFFGEYLSILGQYDGDFSKLMEDPEAMAALENLSDPRFEEASANIEAWMEANC